MPNVFQSKDSCSQKKTCPYIQNLTKCQRKPDTNTNCQSQNYVV